MTFKDVVIKNFKHNLKTYSAFYLCSTFTITLFFIFTTLLYNKVITDFLNEIGMNMIFTMIMSLISVFAIMFISYVHTSMKKKRSKEFGLLLTFGMTSKDIGKINVIEDALLSGMTIGSGVLVGALFSRLVHMFVNRLMVSEVPYSLSYKCFVTTIIAFIFIFTVVILRGWLRTRKLEILKLLKEERKTEYAGNGKVLFLILGIVMVIGFILVAILATNNKELASKSIITIPCMFIGFGGTYLIIAHIFPILLAFIRRRKKLYHNHMIMLTEAKYTMEKNKKLIFLSTILCTIIITCFSSSLAIRLNIENSVDQGVGADLEYIEAGTINHFEDSEFKRIMSEENLQFKSETKFECLFVDAGFLSAINGEPLTAISESTLKSISTDKISVPKGTARLLGYAMFLPKLQDPHIIINKGISERVLAIENLVGISPISNGMYKTSKYTIVLNDEDYLLIKETLKAGMIGIVHRYDVDHWVRSKGFIEKMTVLSEQSKKSNGAAGALMSLGISGKYIGFENFKKMNAIIVFTFMFLCLLFYFASILMLLLRQFEALERTRKKYNQLRKIGITKKEFGRAVFGEVRIIFLTPVVFAVILSFAWILLILAVFGMVGVAEIMKKVVLFTSVYILLQFISCQVAGITFINRVTE
ncbi:MAG: FtsX-like permease family protein [Vallitaleaceae bacterium]|nr:FtsX-like permease family protein [Vallitaleaceae bacterium]